MKAATWTEPKRPFSRAAEIGLSEVPHYEVLIRIAEIKCLRHAGDARDLLTEFACMLDVDAGKKNCYKKATGGDIGEQTPDVTPQCFDRMCGEIYLVYYEEPTAEDLARMAVLRGERNRIDRVCSAQTEKLRPER